MRKPDHSEDTVVHDKKEKEKRLDDKKEKEKRLDDSCQHIKTPVGKDADSVTVCKDAKVVHFYGGNKT